MVQQLPQRARAALGIEQNIDPQRQQLGNGQARPATAAAGTTGLRQVMPLLQPPQQAVLGAGLGLPLAQAPVVAPTPVPVSRAYNLPVRQLARDLYGQLRARGIIATEVALENAPDARLRTLAAAAWVVDRSPHVPGGRPADRAGCAAAACRHVSVGMSASARCLSSSAP